MSTDHRHPANDDCHGRGVAHCPECRVAVCPCERAFGHDCEDPEVTS